MVSEWLKIRKKIIIPIAFIIPILINALLTFDLNARYFGYLIPNQSATGLSNWQLIFKEQTIFYFSELLPLFGALILYEIFALETKNNGWNLLNYMPYKKSKIVLVKYVFAMISITLLLISNILTVFLAGIITGVEGKVDYVLFLKVFGIQWFSMLGVMSILLCLILCVKKIVIVIPLAMIIGLISGQIYYDAKSSINQYNPFSFASFCFRADSETFMRIVVSSVIISAVFIVLSIYIFNRKEKLE